MKRFPISVNRSLSVFFLLGAILLGSYKDAFSTQTTAPERGMNAGKSYSISDIETIALQTGNLMFNIPLGSLPAGRGGMSAGVSLYYNSKLWDVVSMDTLDPS